jgi:archaellin
MKLSPGSNAIKLDQTLMTMNVYDRTATLLYRGTSGTYENDASAGFYTLSSEVLPTYNGTATALTEDYDMDGTLDQVVVGSSNETIFILSSGVNETVQTFVCDGTDQAGNYTTDGTFINNVEVTGNCTAASGANAIVEATPQQLGEGFFTVEYLQRGTNPVPGNLQTGDVIRVYYEAPREIGEDEEVRLNFIPKIGTPTLTQFLTPEVISIERVYLYP